MSIHHVMSVVVLTALVVMAVVSVPLAGAQEGPPQVGLRPDAPPYAMHGPYWVGTMEFEAETDYHPTIVAVWYPALNPNGVDENVAYSAYDHDLKMAITWQGHAIKDATPNLAGGPYPLIIFAHGFKMARFNYAYLVEHLASQGLVVMSIEYADSCSLTADADEGAALYIRPKDVSWQIDFAESLTTEEGIFNGMIDVQRLAVMGQSLGATTALAAGGAQLDLSGPTSACNEYGDFKRPFDNLPLRSLCADVAQKLITLVGLETTPEGLWPSWGDPRVDAVVALAPGMFFSGSESLQGLTVPAMVIVGSKDSIFSDFPLYIPYMYENLGSTIKSLILFEGADHFVYNDSCEAAPHLVRTGFSWICSDPAWDMDRAHDLINHFTTAFLLAELYGDEDATAALAPDAVQFPGITYETQGF